MSTSWCIRRDFCGCFWKLGKSRICNGRRVQQQTNLLIAVAGTKFGKNAIKSAGRLTINSRNARIALCRPCLFCGHISRFAAARCDLHSTSYHCQCVGVFLLVLTRCSHSLTDLSILSLFTSFFCSRRAVLQILSMKACTAERCLLFALCLLPPYSISSYSPRADCCRKSYLFCGRCARCTITQKTLLI